MEKYIVIELQTNQDGTVGNLVFAYDAQAEAEAKYHAILSSAAVSGLPKHAALWMTNDGYVQEAKCYEH